MDRRMDGMVEMAGGRVAQAPGQPNGLLARFHAIRRQSVALAAPLSAEDAQAQSMGDASPVKWHLAHTSWFFETFLLEGRLAGYRPFDPAFRLLFNSYYNGVGVQFPRAARGLLTRPSLDEVMAWRGHVDAAMGRLLEGAPDAEVRALVELGLAHEEQHQELILTDCKHLMSANPLRPAYAAPAPARAVGASQPGWVALPGRLVEIGDRGAGFAFDNERPRHRRWLEPFELATRPVTEGEWLRFIEDGGYDRPELWLAAGWDRRQAEGWEAPLYWRRTDEGWRCFTLGGERPIEPGTPVCHVSFFEAEAFARWAGARLPSEAEWEVAAAALPLAGDFADSGRLHPEPDAGGPGLRQMFGTVWEWTRSAYEPYPGFRAAEGAVGEYNGKFMIGQQVLRGGSCATPPGHVRASYRNFFPPEARWQFSGLRLARDRAEAARTGVRMWRLGGFARDAADEARAGLMEKPARISSAHFYDEVGCHLFEAITGLADYGLTRAEAGILAGHGRAMAREVHGRLGEGFQLVDLGAGNCRKAEALLRVLNPSRYVGVDVAGDFLEAALARVADGWGGEVAGVAQDFARHFHLPPELADRPTLFFYPGSSIGNFTPEGAETFLRQLMAAVPRSALLLGADLVRAEADLVRAYDDAAGVTAAFNRNILAVLNAEAGTDFEPARWRHVALWNAGDSRIEMWLEAGEAMEVRWPGGVRCFAAGERILTEISTKWEPARLEALMAAAGFGGVRLWTDEARSFAVALGGAVEL